MREPRSSGTVRSALARSVHQHRAFLELSRVVAAGEAGLWTGAMPILLAPGGASWGAAYRLVGATLELAATEGVPMSLRAHVEAFDMARHASFAVCKAVRTRRPSSDERLFSNVLGTRAFASLEAAGISGGTAVPIIHGGAVFGVLLVGSPLREGIDSEALTFLDAAASFLAPALALAENLRHVGVERTTAPARKATSSAPPRSPRGSVPPRKNVADVTRAVNDALQQAAPALRSTGVDVRVTGGDEEHFTLSDPNDLRLAIAHLLVNAAESVAERAPVAGAPSHPRRVRIALSREGAMIAVCVDDSGRGVPHDLRARVFEAGFSTKGKGRGTGLHFVRQLTQELGGHVEIASSDLGGASFRLVLPSSSVRPEPTPTVNKRRTSATWPQMHATGRERDAKPEGGGGSSGGESSEGDPGGKLATGVR